MRLSPIASGLPLLLSLVTAQNLSAQEAVNKFQIHAGSRLNGTEEYTVSMSGNGYQLRGTTHLRTGELIFDLRHAEKIGRDGKFSSYKLEGTVGGQAESVGAWVEGKAIMIEATAGGRTQKKTAAFRDNTVVSDRLIAGHYQILLSYLGGERLAQPFWFVVPQALSAVPGKVASDGDVRGLYQGQEIELQKYTVDLNGLSIELWAEGEGRRLTRAEVPRQDIRMVRDGFVLESNPPETAQPGSFVERQITFPSLGVQVPGTLCLPAKHQGNLPIVVMVQVSGFEDRDGKIGRDYPFRDLAHGLAAAGVATLRYDRRTYAFPPPADPAAVSLDREITNDALAALEFAATVPEAKSVFLLGHSLGGTMAPYIAARYPATRGIVLMAAASSPIDLTLAEQKRRVLERQGKSDRQIEEELASQSQIFADIRAGKIPATRMINGAPASYWLDWMKRDPAGELKKLDIPVLILEGGRDSQVFQADYDRFEQALKGRDAEFYWLPNLNHLFMPAQAKSPFDHRRPSHVDQQVVAIIANWLRKIRARPK
jgi:pimeloyl-ACP methyl ester carboxylesterase